MSVNEQYPLCAAIRHERPVFISSLATNPDYPVLAGIWQANRTRALGVVPILRGEQVIGAAGWAFRDAQRFGEAEKRTWMSIAQNAASLVDDGAASAQPVSNTGA